MARHVCRSNKRVKQFRSRQSSVDYVSISSTWRKSKHMIVLFGYHNKSYRYAGLADVGDIQ